LGLSRIERQLVVDGGGRKRSVAESNTQVMQIADDIARCVKASRAYSLMVVNDEITSLRARGPKTDASSDRTSHPNAG
jgi:hypothetical protein